MEIFKNRNFILIQKVVSRGHQSHHTGGVGISIVIKLKELRTCFRIFFWFSLKLLRSMARQ